MSLPGRLSRVAVALGGFLIFVGVFLVVSFALAFYDLVKADNSIMKYLNESDLKEVFDYNKSKKNVDYIFKRLGIK